MARAAEFIRFDLPSGFEYYEKGFEAFEEAQRKDPGNIITWWALLRYSLRVLEQLNLHEGDVPPRIAKNWKATGHQPTINFESY